MKSPISTLSRAERRIILWLLSIIVAAAHFTLQAEPRAPQPPWPERTLGIFGWDEGYWYVPVRPRAIGAEQARMIPSWSGFALTRGSQEDVPVAIPAVGPDGRLLVAPDHGAARVWFSPRWSSVGKAARKGEAAGKGPGQPARLLELVNLGGQFPDIRWTLHVNAEGTQLRLAGIEFGRVKELLVAPLDLTAGEWRLITLCYSPEGTELWLDGELLASGAGLKPGITGWEDRLGLMVGSAFNGLEGASGRFEEVALFDYWPTAEQQRFYFQGVSKRARLGPVGTPEEEILKMDLVSALDGPPGPPGEGGGGGGDSGGTNAPAYNYAPGTFYVEILSATNQQAQLRLMNTVPDLLYELQSAPQLTNGLAWSGETPFVVGAAGATSTLASVPWLDRTNRLFLQARAWTDSDGDGLPDWWELAHGLDPDLADTGSLGISDGYQDGDGDGWTNLEELQNGTNPAGFNTPPAPRGVTAAFGATTTNVNVRWNQNPGSVTSYTVERSWNFQTVTFQVSAGLFSYGDAVPANSDPFWQGPWAQPGYRVKANYAAGSSDWSAPVQPANRVGGMVASVGRGPQGKQRLVVSARPARAASVRLWRIKYLPAYGETNFTVAAGSLVNGVYELPSAWTPLLGTNDEQYQWWAQPVAADGTPGTATFAGWNRPIPFFDGREQLRQNLAFQLRAANRDLPLEFERDWSLAQSREWYDYAWNSTHYAHAGLAGFSMDHASPTAALTEWQPFDDNHTYRNLAFDAGNLTGGGKLNTGAGHGPGTLADLEILSPASFEFVPPASEGTISAILSSSVSQWLYHEPYYSSGPVDRIGISDSGGNWVMAANAKNLFGLPYISAKRANSGGVTTLNAGGSMANTAGYFYPETAQPQLQTVGYYFGQMDAHVLPGHAEFAVTNTTPLLVTGIGNPWFTLAGYAKQAIQNGYANKFGYLGQYFEKAQKQGTTNATGVLSPYGEFLPTEPGPVELVTMPDLSTGQRGTGVVHVIKLQLDVNHDGVMDLSWTGPDNANTSDRPFRFWVNNDHDAPASGGELERDVPLNPQGPSVLDGVWDSADGLIRSQRDLEDFARLWVRGVPNIKASDGYSVSLWINPWEGDPRLRIYRAAEANGGIGYLTNVAVAASQLSSTNIGGSPVHYWLTLGEVSAEEEVDLPLATAGGLSLTNFLFEASGAGKGTLILSIWQGTEEIAYHHQHIEFRDVKDMYEQAVVTDVIPTWPEMVQQSMISGFRVSRPLNVTADESKELAVFVHGWRMPQAEYHIFSESMFKRLYWQGFQGRFASLRWPTRSTDMDEEGLDYLTFNRSEHIAFKSGIGAALYFYDLRQRFPDHTISVCSHSQGNIVMMEALKTLVIAEEAPLDHYVLMQAAVPAHSYDTTITNLPTLISAEGILPTPNTYANYAAGITNALRQGGKIVNFFNPSDFALAAGLEGTTFGSWEFNQGFIFPTQDQGLISMKPLVLFGYYHSGTTSYVTTNYWNAAFSVTPRTVTDPRERMPFIARSRSKAVGAQAGVGSLISSQNQVNLSLPPFEFTNKDFDHSGQFNRNIQEAQIRPFYGVLRSTLFPE